MKALIKKVKEEWVVNFNHEVNTFTTHEDAVRYAYDGGADDFQIQYSNSVGRTFARPAIESLVLGIGK